MTLPYPDKPAITDTISTILSNIKDNFTSLASESKFKACTFTKDIAVTGNVSTTGIGFSPRVILFFAEEPVSDCMCWGIYTYGSTHPDMAIYENVSGDVASNGVYSMIFSVTGGSAASVVASRDADGFTLTWSHPNGSPTGTATVIAFCIR